MPLLGDFTTHLLLQMFFVEGGLVLILSWGFDEVVKGFTPEGTQSALDNLAPHEKIGLSPPPLNQTEGLV